MRYIAMQKGGIRDFYLIEHFERADRDIGEQMAVYQF